MADGPWNDYKQTPAPIHQGGPWEDYAATPAAGDASGKMGGLVARAKDVGSRLTADYDPGAQDMNPVARTLSSIGGAVMGAPGAIKHAFTDPYSPEEQAEATNPLLKADVLLKRLTGARSIKAGVKDWLNPQTRPTWEQVKSV